MGLRMIFNKKKESSVSLTNRMQQQAKKARRKFGIENQDLFATLASIEMCLDKLTPLSNSQWVWNKMAATDGLEMLSALLGELIRERLNLAWQVAMDKGIAVASVLVDKYGNEICTPHSLAYQQMKGQAFFSLKVRVIQLPGMSPD